MSVRTTVRLPEELLRQAKRKAAEEGRTLTALIEHGLRTIVSQKRRAEPLSRIDPPVSAAKGGLRSGIDWNRLEAAEQEFTDRELAGASKRSG